MQKAFRLVLLLPVSLLVIGIAIVWSAAMTQAQSPSPLTDAQRQQIIENCVPAKSTLTQLHASDALLRVNRGQLYESTASKFMDRFNDRLGSNSLDNKAMTTVTGSYRTQLTTFRSDYIEYERKLSAALAVDCTTKPVEFYSIVEEARTLRKKVHNDVNKLHQLIDDYRSSVGTFLVNYERLSK